MGRGAGGEGPEPELFAQVRALLAGGSPAGFLELISGLVAAADPVAGGGAGGVPSLGELVATFAGVERDETTALLAGFAALASAEDARRAASRELASRRHPLPDWLASLDRARLARAARSVRDPIEEQELLVELEVVGGAPVTVVVLLGSPDPAGCPEGSPPVPDARPPGRARGAPVDAYVSGEPLEALFPSGAPGGPGARWWELDPEVARAELGALLGSGAGAGVVGGEDRGSQRWSAVRPLLDWVARIGVTDTPRRAGA